MTLVDKYASIATETAKLLAGHVMRPADARSVLFRDAAGGGFYWFQLTWNPGHLHLSGDCGNLTLTHSNALARFEDGMSWAAESDADYLLGKSDKRPEYDRDATFAHLIDEANRPVIEALNGCSTNRWVRPEGWTEGRRLSSVPRRVEGFRHELQAWRRLPENDRCERECLGDDPRAIKPKKPAFGEYWDSRTPIEGGVEFDECWTMWLRLWRLIIGEGYFHGSTLSSPQDVLRPEKRREIKRELEGRLEDANSAADACSRLGMDGLYRRAQALTHGSHR